MIGHWFVSPVSFLFFLILFIRSCISDFLTVIICFWCSSSSAPLTSGSISSRFLSRRRRFSDRVSNSFAFSLRSRISDRSRSTSRICSSTFFISPSSSFCSFTIGSISSRSLSSRSRSSDRVSNSLVFSLRSWISDWRESISRICASTLFISISSSFCSFTRGSISYSFFL